MCLSEIFTNTKLDLGTCPRAHSNKLRIEFNNLYAKAEEEKDSNKLAELNRLKVEYENTVRPCARPTPAYTHSTLYGRYEPLWKSVIVEFELLSDDWKRRRKRITARLLSSVLAFISCVCCVADELNGQMREIGEIEGAYQAAMASVESLGTPYSPQVSKITTDERATTGSEGKVDESMKELGKAEALKGEKEEKEKELQQLTETSGASGHQKLRVCDICGAYLSVLDSDRRLADHFGGKVSSPSPSR